MSAAASPNQPVVELPGFHSPLEPSRALRVGGRTHYSREYVSEVQRSRIEDAFVQVVAEEGYDGAGIKVICRRAGVAFNTFYEYYDTKENLFFTVYDRGAAALVLAVADTFHANEGTWLERVEQAARTLLQVLADNPAFARFCIVEVHKVGNTAMQRVDRQFSDAFLAFRDVAPSPRLPMDLEDLLPLVFGGIYMRLYFTILAGKTGQLPDLLPQLMEFVLVTLGDQGEAG